MQQWNAGCYEARTLFRAIQQQGYRGSYQTVARYVQRLRQAQGLKLRQLPRRRLCRTLVDANRKVLTARRAAWLVLRRPEHRNQEEHALFSRIQHHPSFRRAIELAEAFIELVRQRQGEQLDQWLAQAFQCSIAPLRRFAESLNDDYAAVRAGLTLAVSNGQTEGQINRLKMIKRQMYGRAGLALLRQRFLLAG
ncbi:transposase [Cyanobacteria bacterium FACHB-63]|nr:transposase [Cyanobacteria bacterium FACHB-63]